MKPRKVRDRSISPEGRAVPHQAADEIFVCGQELRWAVEGLCMTEDSQSATDFGGQVGNVVFPITTHEAPLMRESGEQDQCQENEPQ